LRQSRPSCDITNVSTQQWSKLDSESDAGLSPDTGLPVSCARQAALVLEVVLLPGVPQHTPGQALARADWSL